MLLLIHLISGTSLLAAAGWLTAPFPEPPPESEEYEQHSCNGPKLSLLQGSSLKILHQKPCQAMEAAARGSGGVTLAGRIQKM